MGHLVLTFAAIVASTGAVALLCLVRMASICSRDEDSARVAARFMAGAHANEPTTLAFSPAA